MRITRITKEKAQETIDKKVDLSLLDPLIEKYKSKKGNMIPLLQGTQSIFGFLPEESFYYVSERTGLKTSDMFGVATFYAQFRLVPAGKYIVKVCHGTACHVQDANKITEALIESLKVNDGETTPDGLFTLESVACIGCCSLAPVMMIGDDTYGKLTEKSCKKVIREIKLSENN
ncbi:MAG: NADH-quinone oxidoreductase subunit NuoE [Bacteroidetes bacterium]|nr:NADH-quinone oxidoreductase subunit NuoE [Bacteroidota bacterium]MBT5529368.1 NADH-quinone oxidoreductase subunit NuoE [Cytophagia bacterium]MBT3422685.1 NADH-quinone oxidoreductase subunit NuoE [Bacteroidota bacterium]MBT4398705.1 NADH-quinone oxidoreductase subunit NuoE [Bacteroidota bacterium]MBT4728782.1 NADH-quinone oxidoreductase subunit NuoE [Bacteroidota bacterium]